MASELKENHVVVWHNLAVELVFKKLQSSPQGLNDTLAQARLRQYGENNLPQLKKQTLMRRVLQQFNHVLIYVLLVCAVITLLLGHFTDTGVILAVVFINALVGLIQEGKAEKAMNAIRHILAPHANVIRDGERLNIKAQQLVPGDVVLLEAGDKVPADLRLFTVHHLLIQEAILTGESVAVHKHCQPVAEDTSLGDRSCMAFSGTQVVSGQGKGIVVETGSSSEIGQISGLINAVQTLTTPLITQLATFAKWLTGLILVIALLLLAYGYFGMQYNFNDMFMAVVGLSVAAIPEGLPAVLTITLAIGVQAMARRNAIVRRLPAIETVGAVSVICTDKTGTLTCNEMMVTSVIDHQQRFTVQGEGYSPIGTLQLDGQAITLSEHSALTELALAAMLCNDASLQKRHEIWRVEGDPMEGALLSFAAKIAGDLRQQQSHWTRTDAIPFDAKQRFMATLNHDHEGHAFIFVKGAPEQVLAMCHDQRGNHHKSMPLDKPHWHKQAAAIAATGQRILAFAIKPTQPEHTVLEHADLNGSLTLLGMVGMIDPPRQEAISAIAECRQAGIRVKMITGDHAQTASAIAQQIGLQNPNNVLTGEELDRMDDANLSQAVLSCDVFARTTPAHKLRLVMALQSHHLTVAMTGDGVNDAPALKRADVGVAMGRSGSEAAKEASDLVLADDNFSSIVAAIREGRTVYDNIKKIISWTLPTNAGEALTIIVALLLGMILPITPIQILWVNLITAVTLGIALAFEPTEKNTMLRLPRLRNEPLLSAALVWHIVLVSLLFLGGVFGVYHFAINKGYSIELARSIALNTLVVMEIFHLFFIRNIYGTSLTWQGLRGTKVIWSVVIIITLAQFAVTYLPFLQIIFATQAIPFWDGAVIIGIGIAFFTIIEIEKQIRLALRLSR